MLTAKETLLHIHVCGFIERRRWRNRTETRYERSVSDAYNKGDASAQTRLWIH
jgi:hypothetical protein